jgi:hypothetical protein
MCFWRGGEGEYRPGLDAGVLLAVLLFVEESILIDVEDVRRESRHHGLSTVEQTLHLTRSTSEF